MTRASALLCLALSAAGYAQSGLRVNEVNTGVISFVEVANLGPDIVYMAGYKLYWGCNVGVTPVFTSGFFTFPTGTVLYPGQIAVLTENVTGTIPSVPAGVYRVYIGSALPWAQMPAGSPSTSRNGVAVLVSPTNVGLDRVQWGTPTTSFDSIAFGATISGGVTFTGAAVHRTSNADTDAPTDFVSSALGSPGFLTPAGPSVPGQTVIVGLTISLTTTGGGQLTMTTTSQNPALPFAEHYNLVSLQNYTPNGSGPVFGVGADVIQLAVTPASLTNPFHTFFDVTGVYSLSLPAGVLPVGLHLEAAALTVVGGVITRISTVSEVNL